MAVERSLETQVSQAVDAWLKWLPRWEPATHRGRVAPCRRCFGSPVLSAAGLGSDVPHGVQHGLSTRIKTIVDHAVAEYTARNLPMLQAELDQQAARNRARSYRPSEGLEPEYEGLPLDPDPIPGAPFLFTISGLAEAAKAQNFSPGMPGMPPIPASGPMASRIRFCCASSSFFLASAWAATSRSPSTSASSADSRLGSIATAFISPAPERVTLTRPEAGSQRSKLK